MPEHGQQHEKYDGGAEHKEKRLAERLMAIGRPGLELPAVGNCVVVMNFGTRQEFSGA
jgi:hypothetical protein